MARKKKKRKKTSTVRKKTTTTKRTKKRTHKRVRRSLKSVNKWLSGVVKRADHLVGTSNRDRDRNRQAMAPGKRKAGPHAKRPYYYEYRANRADLTPEGL
ncbi:hypothetical protein DRP04_06420 [Archaeoglobales archaeon]|nr:MAG: hypothetical protein DRP04_06420 [Archaeoglobales archaeon]